MPMRVNVNGKNKVITIWIFADMKQMETIIRT